MKLIENIESVWNAATQDEVESGIMWYPTAHKIAREIAPTLEAGAGVIAALSPLMPWDRNMYLARESFATGIAFGGLSKNVAKAQAIIDGAVPLEVLGGDKVRTFYGNIVNPWGDGVTIDRHAYDIAVGVKHGKVRPNIGKGVYREFSQAYIDAAAEIGILPLELQAVTWTTWRRIHGIK